MPGGKTEAPDWAGLLLPGLAAAEAGAFFVRQMAEAFAAPQAPSEPGWASANEIVLSLAAARLRRFAEGAGRPVIVCAPFAVHGAQVADLAPGHSLMQVLRGARAPLYLVEWLTTPPERAGRRIDDLLADLNVFVDEVGGVADLVGLCQGGWLSLVFTARFPQKAGKLVLAGAPIDIEAGASPLSELARATSLDTFRELVALGGGLARGAQAARFWSPLPDDPEGIRALLQSDLPCDSPEFPQRAEAFRRWRDYTLDLPGAYYLETVENFYKNNALARGDFVALGKRLDLRAVKNPLFLLAARDDDVTAPDQALACARKVATPKRALRRRTVAGGHLSLLFGARNLRGIWSEVAAWLQRSPAQKA